MKHLKAPKELQDAHRAGIRVEMADLKEELLQLADKVKPIEVLQSNILT